MALLIEIETTHRGDAFAAKTEASEACKARGIFVSRFIPSPYSHVALVESRSEDAAKALAWAAEDQRVTVQR